MKIRTVTVGLPGTYKRCNATNRILESQQPKPAESWQPHTRPVSVLGEFMLSYLAFAVPTNGLYAYLSSVDLSKVVDP